MIPAKIWIHYFKWRIRKWLKAIGIEPREKL
jgi:hypothetical protein